MESAPSNGPSRCKSMKISRRNLPYYVGHLVLVTLVTLPTIFYVFQPDHPSHSRSNETISNSTNSEATNSSNQSWTAKNLTSSEGLLPLECNSPLVFDQESGQCRPPCDWTTQSPLTQKAYYIVIIVGLWAALIATVITFITWAGIKNLRKFPHVLRFHIMVCCILLAQFKMIPIHKPPETTFCKDEKFWLPSGQSSIAAIIQGAMSHYFGLAHSFWTMCFVANTYAVIIHHNRAVFKQPIKIHLMQSVLGWLVPALIVAGCLYFARPGYKFYFMDLMTAGAAGFQMAYFAVTLPMQVTLGVSLCLLWSIVWHLRKARLDSTKRVIRAREERVSMRRVERQFLSMAVLMLFVVGLNLAITTVTVYRIGDFIHEANSYFNCLKVSKNCKSPSYNTVLPLLSVVAPGFICIAFFFLLFMNKDCRQIWISCFQKCKKIFDLCKPPPGKIRDETDRSRCSSTLTVMSDRRASEHFTFNTTDPVLRLTHPYLFRDHLTGVNIGKPRSSTLSLPVSNQRRTVANINVEIRVTPPQNDLDKRTRCHSVPVFLAKENIEDTEQINLDLPSRDSSDVESTSSVVSDTNSETRLEGESFIRDIEKHSSRL